MYCPEGQAEYDSIKEEFGDTEESDAMCEENLCAHTWKALLTE